MTHAQASTGGDESKSSSSHRSRKFMNVTVYFLDDSSHVFQLQAKNMGQVLFEKVCKFINLLEVDYFGLEFEDEKKTKCWLDALKPLCSQIATSFPTMFFCVKFYTPDPVQLEDEFTKYLFGLQVKKDLANGFLQCNDNTAAVMISYIVQADFGDYNPDKCTDSSYLSEYKFVPLQDADLERKIMENHKKLIGQTPAEADVNLLETARRCELYGIKMTAAKDHEGVPLNLAIAHLGVLVFQNYTKINTFSWAKIRKLSFKRKKFLIKLHPEGYGYYKDTVEFFFDGRNECKNFWKKCIENHTFFRCTDAKQGMRQKPKIFSRGSSFRYSGRTQKQVSEFVREISVKRQPFQRSTSLRTPSSPSRSIGSVISPQPILPVTSLSCGSISDISKEALPPQKVLSTSEPTTPHVLPDIHGSMNGDYSKTPDTPLSGLVSPEFECSQEGFVSPDFYTQDTDDNISHDSYHVLEKEAHSTNNDCMPTNTNNASDGKVEESGVALTNGTNNDGGNANQMIIDENAREDHKNLEKLENNNNTISEPIPRNPNRIPLEEETVKELNSSNRSDYYSNSSRSENSTENYPKIEVQACIERINDERSQLSSINSINRLSEDTGFESQKSVDENYVTENRFKDSEQNSMGENYNVLHDTQQNFGTSTFYISSPYAVRLANKKKSLSDKTYCLAKELLMTERTYRKDLEIVDVVFRDEFYKQGDVNSSAVVQVLSIIDPLYEKHCSLLRDLEQRLAFWEGRPANRSSTGIKGIGDVLLAHKAMIQIHSTYLAKLPEALELLYTQLSSNPNFAQVYHQFEAQKLCYLPLTSFLLRPAFRLSYYSSVVKDLLNCYNSQHDDYENCLNMSNELKSPCESFDSRIFPVVNYVKLMELQRSLIGFTNLVDKNREFIREGSLFKFTKTGSHQHMFFLFSDVVLYTIRVHDGQLRFKVQAQLPIAGLKVDETEPKHGVNHCFVLCSSEKHLVVGAPSERELSKWLEDLRMSVQNAKGKKGPIRTTSSHSLNNTSFDEKYESSDDADDMIGQRDEKMGSLHINTSIHICWHRNISISGKDLLLSMKHSLSGYLLRKFKNSSGWQKVWVVLANLCLFFYRSYLDESPLASLPLAGYRIMNTASTDLVHGDCIFKLVFKNHEYFFTVENKHTFERWMEAISVCTLTEEENTRL